MLPTYLTTSQADALAAQLPGLAAYKALPDDASKLATLSLASMRVDASRRWQGRKYDPDQVLEFPRLPYGSSVRLYAGGVWDWDTDAQQAVVPQNVKLAVLYEADSIAAGTLDRVRNAIASGLASQSTGSLSEAYNTALAGVSAMALCPESERLMSRYKLATGGMR